MDQGAKYLAELFNCFSSVAFRVAGVV